MEKGKRWLTLFLAAAVTVCNVPVSASDLTSYAESADYEASAGLWPDDLLYEESGEFTEGYAAAEDDELLVDDGGAMLYEPGEDMGEPIIDEWTDEGEPILLDPEPAGETSAAGDDGIIEEVPADGDIYADPSDYTVPSDNTAPVNENTQQEDLKGEENFLEDEEETPEGVRYIRGRPLTDEERAAQLEPMKNLEEIPEVGLDPSQEDLRPRLFAKVGAAPPVYDARQEGIVSPVKNQGHYLDCWAFSLASLLETSLLSKGSGLYDLSEEHLAYFWCHRENDPLGNTPNDVNSMYGEFHSGGNPQLGAFHLSTWSGAAQDALYPIGTGPFDASAAYDSAAFLQNTVFFSNAKTNTMSARVTRIKNMILTYKSAAGLISFSTTAYGSQGNYYNPDTAAFCNPNEGGVNHAITIVGWDDSYSKNNFSAASEVTTDGAWIVKNSWGDWWGDEGYFYMSYEDMSLSSIVCASGTISPEYPNNYFYDGTVGVGANSLQNQESIAAVFQAKAGSGFAETLGEIVTASGTDTATFSAQVYMALTDPSNPESGRPAWKTPVTLKQTYHGMETHKVPDVDIAPGTYFSVVLTNTTGKQISYYFEKNIAYSWCSFIAGTDTNQTFGKTGSVWTDLGANNLSPRIKVHTRTENFVPEVFVSESEITLYSGSTYNLSISANPASYRSPGYGLRTSNSTIAALSKNVITAKKCGTATITISLLKAPKVTCTVTVNVVPPPAPSGIGALSASYDKSIAFWNSVPDVSGYEIYRSEQGGEAVLRSVVDAEGLPAFMDTEDEAGGFFFRPGYRYSYYVVAFTDVGADRIRSDPTATRTIVPLKMLSETTTVRSYPGRFNEISYNKITGADGYRIYRCEDYGDWELLYTRNSGTPAMYRDSYRLKPLKRYQYKVVPYRLIEGEKYDGPYSVSSTVIWR